MTILPVRLADRLKVGILGLLALTAIAVYTVMALGAKPMLVEAGTRSAEESAAAIAGHLAANLQEVQGTTAAMARVAERLPHDVELTKGVLENILQQSSSEIASGGLAPLPNAFTPGVERRSFFWSRDAQGRMVFSDGYNAPDLPPYYQEPWFVAARNGKPGTCVWSEAYRDPVTGVDMTTCSIGYRDAKGEFAGVATLDLKLAGLSAFLAQQSRDAGSYVFALDGAGNVLYFPDLSSGDKGLPNLSGLVGQNPWFKPVADRVANLGDQPTTLYLAQDQRLGGPSYVTLLPMADTGWRIGLANADSVVTGMATRLTQLMLLLLLPSLGALLGLAWLASRRLLTQLNETTAQIERLGQEGMHASELDIRRPDEIGQLRLAVNHYAGSLRQMLQRIAGDAVALERQAVELAKLSDGLAERAEQQREDNTLLATAITEMSASAGEVAHNTTDCSDTARQSLSTVQNGQHQLQRSNAVLQGLASDIGGAATAIVALGADIERVGSVLAVIKSISEQTNLLALNAAIEAARAGEQGRGFAVVADEVRTLAGRTQASANEIQDMIAKLRQASNTAVATMQDGVRGTETAVHEATSVSSTLDGTVASFDDIVQRAQQIAVAAQEQSHVTQEINELAIRIHTSSEEGAQAAGTLRNLGREIKALSSRLTALSQGNG
ncbi:methyl-accepting chemotaxis protein [uncultured Pseudomonas sp.]|uniref:methyl-accepting chemotaxis protein n=1 Tax=uncultured Pseudomonas sp. TaxID=114707 RepID=UPI0025D75C23|nr:methyl-accepting chemotaxis protein [uncultured Pseudomonas sp.]